MNKATRAVLLELENAGQLAWTDIKGNWMLERIETWGFGGLDEPHF